MSRLVIAAAILLNGCVASPDARAPVVHEYSVPKSEGAACPPLPVLPAGATRFEERLLNAAIRDLYAQCAESKK